MSEQRVTKLAEEVDELHRENARLREALLAVRAELPARQIKARWIIQDALGDTPDE